MLASLVSSATPLAAAAGRFNLRGRVGALAADFRTRVADHHLFPRVPSSAECQVVLDSYRGTRIVPAREQFMWLSLVDFVGRSLAHLEEEGSASRDDVQQRTQALLAPGALSFVDAERFAREMNEAFGGSLPRMVATLPDEVYDGNRETIARLFPDAGFFREGLKQPIPTGRIRELLRFEEGRDHTTLFLGGGDTEGMYHDAIRAAGAAGKVVIIDLDGRVLQRTREMLGSPRQVVYIEGDYSDPAVIAPYAGQADRVYVIHPNHFQQAVVPARALLKAGGLFFLQHAVGPPDEEKSGPAGDEDQVMPKAHFSAELGLVDCAPVFKTHDAALFPAGNVFAVGRRR